MPKKKKINVHEVFLLNIKQFNAFTNFFGTFDSECVITFSTGCDSDTFIH